MSEKKDLAKGLEYLFQINAGAQIPSPDFRWLYELAKICGASYQFTPATVSSGIDIPSHNAALDAVRALVEQARMVQAALAHSLVNKSVWQFARQLAESYVTQAGGGQAEVMQLGEIG